MPRAAWTWTESFLLCTARTAAKSPPTTSSSCWPTSGSESLPISYGTHLFSFNHLCFLHNPLLDSHVSGALFEFARFFVVSYHARPEKSKLQIIPGQLNVTIECVPPDFSSIYHFFWLPTWKIQIIILRMTVKRLIPVLSVQCPLLFCSFISHSHIISVFWFNCCSYSFTTLYFI